MKYRQDFVTNSSSANYVLQLILESKDKQGVGIGFAASPEGAFAFEDRPVTIVGYGFEGSAGVVYALIKEAIEDGVDMDALCDQIMETIEVDNDGVEDDFDEDDEYDDEYDDDDRAWTSGTAGEIFPKSIQEFKQELKKRNIQPDNILTVIIENCKEGNGDSAMWVEFRDLFSKFLVRYNNADKANKEIILKEAAQYILSNPVVPVSDNEYLLDATERLVCEESEESLIDDLRVIFDRNGRDEYGRSYWMVESVSRETVNVATGQEERQFFVRRM